MGEKYGSLAPAYISSTDRHQCLGSNLMLSHLLLYPGDSSGSRFFQNTGTYLSNTTHCMLKS